MRHLVHPPYRHNDSPTQRSVLVTLQLLNILSGSTINPQMALQESRNINSLGRGVLALQKVAVQILEMVCLLKMSQD